MSLSATLVTVCLVVFVYVGVLFVISLTAGRNDIADVGWGMGVFLVGASAYVTQHEVSTLSKVLLLLVAIWAVRLSYRIFMRNRNKSEDARYKQWRESWGKWFYLRSYLQIYLLQGILMVVVGYPLVHAVVFGGSGVPVTVLTIGLMAWLVGFLFEVVSDYQLDTFLSQKKNSGELMQEGLWKYSRHPNYFGEVVAWWGIWYVVLFVPYGFFAIIGPLTITVLILKVSGVPMVERQMSGHPDFAAYKKKTSVFFPLPPKP